MEFDHSPKDKALKKRFRTIQNEVEEFNGFQGRICEPDATLLPDSFIADIAQRCSVIRIVDCRRATRRFQS